MMSKLKFMKCSYVVAKYLEEIASSSSRRLLISLSVTIIYPPFFRGTELRQRR